MKAYVTTTGVLFGAIVLAHVARLADEGVHVAKDPIFILATVVPAALSLWACRLVWQSVGKRNA
jgi:hypothetical protein